MRSDYTRYRPSMNLSEFFRFLRTIPWLKPEGQGRVARLAGASLDNSSTEFHVCELKAPVEIALCSVCANANIAVRLFLRSFTSDGMIVGARSVDRMTAPIRVAPVESTH